MYAVLTDELMITAVFQQLTPLEALQIKYNLEAAEAHLKCPSNDLIEKMQAEGLTPINMGENDSGSLSSFDSSALSGEGGITNAPATRLHTKRLFANRERLIEIFKGLSFAEAIEVKKVLGRSKEFLNLPSPELLAQLRGEGLSLKDLGVDAPETEAKELRDNIKSKLASALEQTKTTSEQDDAPVDKVKLRLNSLLNGGPKAELVQNNEPSSGSSGPTDIEAIRAKLRSKVS